MDSRVASALSSASNAEGKSAAVLRLVEECIGRGDGDGLETVVQRSVAEETRVARTIMLALAQKIREHLIVRKSNTEALEQGGNAAMRAMAAQQAAFEEADGALRQTFFDHYASEGAYGDAARALAGMSVDRKSEAEKASLYVTIAETFLEEDESVEAEGFVNRASSLMQFVPSEDWALQLRYRVTLARTLDARRKFLEAAVSYYELSQARHEELDGNDLVALLAKAVTCALLGPAGPQRTRIVSTLYKDERVNAAMAPSQEYAAHATVLSKMCTGQLVSKADVAAFEATLLPHHKALLPDGMTIPERATIQHNVVALSHVYDNVHFDQVGALLDVEPAKAMHLTARMIADGRLDATIDQVDASLVFTRDDFFSQSRETQTFDADLAALCADVNACYDKIDSILSAHTSSMTDADGGGAAE
mmetsp:Transcript_30580/g.93477  ORF Transcript_30580/g.93477 Transcript_30580/m.93477 type:complete len:421 (+) Transcript_30580:37-1299(+)